MDIVINDANIFFDLYNVGLLDEFFQLPFEFHTVDLVIHEVKQKKQRNAIQKYIDSGQLKVKKYEAREFVQVVSFADNIKGNLSLTDSSVLYYAMKTPHCRLLTSDRQLRNRAKEYHVLVSGIIYVFDQLVGYKVITRKEGAQRLIKLLETNSRLPHSLIEERINLWSK